MFAIVDTCVGSVVATVRQPHRVTWPDGAITFGDNKTAAHRHWRLLPIEFGKTPKDFDPEFERLERTPPRFDGERVVVGHRKRIKASLDALRAQLKAQVKGIRVKLQYGTIAFKGAPIQIDEKSLVNLAAARAAGKSRNWRDADNRVTALSESDIGALFDQITEFVDECFRRQASLEAQIDEAKSVAEIRKINVSEGWPAA